MADRHRIRYGMVGGGPGAFIGGVHRLAANLDGEYQLVAGAFSSDPAKSTRQGAELGLAPARVYGSYTEMAEKEAALPDDERIHVVSIVTPNHLHYGVASTFIEKGFHVICDKPMTTTLDDAESLCKQVSESGALFGLTHNYTGYPMVKQARAMVAAGDIGIVRKIVSEYPQGWLARPIEQGGVKQAVWRTDPKTAGAGALGDIGSHAHNLAHYITRLDMDRMMADVSTIVEGRRVDDDANILVHFENDARGIIYASQVSVGEENNLRIRVYGTKGALEWHQEDPNYLQVKPADGALKVYKRGNDYLKEIAAHNTRLPAGHPEAFIEAFGNIYRNVARTIRAKLVGTAPSRFDLDFPTVYDGARGVHFILTALESGKRREWVDAQYTPPYMEE